jgi:membrane protease YdiL (CAAX protease family)
VVTGDPLARANPLVRPGDRHPVLAAIPFALGTDLGIGDALAYSGAPAIGVSVVVYVVLVNGFGEEIGWRGYLADGLMHRHSEIVTALVVWLVWAGWHLPLFWIVDSFRDFGVAGSIGWFVGLGFGSVVLTWMYRSAQRSILIVALWHSAFNLATATRASAGVAAAVASTAVMVGGILVALRRHARDRPAISS